MPVKNRCRYSGVTGAFVATLACATFATFGCSDPPTAPSDDSELRDDRYCEVIPSVAGETTVTTYVYNTIGYNDCPDGLWSQLTEAEVNREFGSRAVKLNGPRHWVMDLLVESGSSTPDETFIFGGIEMALRGTLITAVGQPTVGDQFYVPNQVQRETIYTYKAGQPIFVLTDSSGAEYVMQSYAQIVDRTLTYEQLPNLKARLTLPAGWDYSTRTLTQDLLMNSNGLAFVVNDDLANSYQLNRP